MNFLKEVSRNTAVSIGGGPRPISLPGDIATNERILTAGSLEPLQPKTGLFSGENAIRNKNILAGGLAGVSALASIAQGRAEARGLEAQAEQQSLVAEQQALAGREQELRLREQLSSTQGNLVASLAASGIGGGSIVQTTLDEAKKRGESELAGIRAGTKAQVLSTQVSSLSSLQRARQARQQGLFGAFGAAAKLGTQKIVRGKV